MCAKNRFSQNEEEKNFLLRKSHSYGSMADIKFDETKFTKNEDTQVDINKNVPKYVRKKTEKPDGGWGWLVVLGVSISNMTTQSIISVFGLLFSQKLYELNIGTSGAALIMSVLSCCLNFSGLITGPVIKKYSYRRTAFAGGCFVATGLILTTYATSLETLIMTYSLFTGLGLGLLYPTTFVAVNSYFSKRKGRAVGLTVAGTGLGQMLLPLLVQYLLGEFGFRGTVLILAGISCHSLLGASLYQPVQWHMKYPEEAEENKRLIEKKEGIERKEEKENLSDQGKEVKQQRKEKSQKEVIKDGCNNKEEKVSEKDDKESGVSRGIWSRIVHTMNWDLMKDPSFVNLVIGQGIVYSANMCFQMLFPFYLESIGFMTADIALCMAVLSGADIIGRLVIPTIADCFKLKSKTVFFTGAALSALARSALVTQVKIANIMGIAVCCGIVRSAIVYNFNLSISEQTTPDKLPSALGINMVFKGISVLSFGPLIGFIRDYTQSFALSMHIASAFFLGIPVLMWALERIIKALKK